MYKYVIVDNIIWLEPGGFTTQAAIKRDFLLFLETNNRDVLNFFSGVLPAN